MHHVHCLRLDFDDALNSQQDHDLSYSLCMPAPVLQTFVLMNSGGDFAFRNDDLGLFHHDAPLLRLIKLQCHIGPFLSTSVFSTVRRCLYQSDSIDSLHNLNQLFTAMSHLEALSVEFDVLVDFDGASIIMFPASLAHFVLLLDCLPSNPEYLLDVMQTVLTQNLNIRNIVVNFTPGYSGVNPKTETVRQLLQGAASSVVTELACWSSCAQHIHVQMTTLDVERHAFLGLPRAIDEQWPQEVLDNITVLRVGDDTWPSSTFPLVSAPALEELEVMLLSAVGAGLFDRAFDGTSAEPDFRLD